MTASRLYFSLRARGIGSQRVEPEFKDEAVWQIVEREPPATEVAQRLDVSAHSLYE